MKTINLLILIVSLLSLVLLSSGQEAQTNDYLILHSLYVFEYQESLPYETIRPMQWDSVNGFSEITESPDYLYTIVDFANREHGYVLQDVTSGACFYLGMQTDDPMLEPHVAAHEWVTCPE